MYVETLFSTPLSIVQWNPRCKSSDKMRDGQRFWVKTFGRRVKNAKHKMTV